MVTLQIWGSRELAARLQPVDGSGFYSVYGCHRHTWTPMVSRLDFQKFRTLLFVAISFESLQDLIALHLKAVCEEYWVTLQSIMSILVSIACFDVHPAVTES
jgi:hypothetical protein